MSDTENSDLYDGASSDAPLIDSLGSAVKRLIDRGRARGFITVEELNKALPSERESSEHIEDIMTSISDMGISIISETDVEGFDGETSEDDVYDDEEDEGGNFDEFCRLFRHYTLGGRMVCNAQALDNLNLTIRRRLNVEVNLCGIRISEWKLDDPITAPYGKELKFTSIVPAEPEEKENTDVETSVEKGEDIGEE